MRAVCQVIKPFVLSSDGKASPSRGSYIPFSAGPEEVPGGFRLGGLSFALSARCSSPVDMLLVTSFLFLEAKNRK